MTDPVLTLTHEPVPISAKFPQIRSVVYGEPGVGKTTLALSFPRPIVIDTDGGLEGDAIIDVSGEEWSPDGWRDLNAFYFWLKTRLDRCDTIIVDSFDAMVRFLMNEVTSQPTKFRTADSWLTSLTDAIPEQRDYLAVQRAMDRFLAQLRQTGKHIVLTSSVREPDLTKGQAKRTINVSPGIEALVMGWTNIAGELTIVKDKAGARHRVLSTEEGQPTRKAKSRWSTLTPGIVDPTYDLIKAGIAQEDKVQK